MPGMGRSSYYWTTYHALREKGKSKSYSAAVASLIEKKHLAKLKRRRK